MNEYQNVNEPRIEEWNGDCEIMRQDRTIKPSEGDRTIKPSEKY